LEVLSNLQQPSALWQDGAVTIGNFDGVHRGHCALIEQLRSAAQDVGGPAVVLTFSPHPIEILRPGRLPPPLTTLERKLGLLEEAGVDACITYPTTRELLNLTPQEFFHSVIDQQVAARAIVEGPNFYFGRDRTGDVQLLDAMCRHAGIRLTIVEPNLNDGDYISSSRIRQAVMAGDVGAASDMLGRDYQVRGVVVEGARRGTTIGFPTANLEQMATLVPSPGVYAGSATSDGQRYAAAIHIGPNPTFDEPQRKLEVHLLDYSGNLYNKELVVEFSKQLRKVISFGSVDELVAQLKQDVASAQNIFLGS
jgi:riboflavin kinase/FMN adenylyltransferase